MFFSEKLLNPEDNNNDNKRIKRNKKNKKEENENENENELLIFGYSCHIFRDDINAERLEKQNGDLLIPWHDDEEYSLYLDRYDVRNLIDEKITLENMEHDESMLNNEEAIYDEDRYMDLDSEEEKLNEMSEDEREIYLEIKRERRLKKERENEKENDETDSDDSTDIEEPTTEQQRKIIEKTAKFITESSNPQIEIVIQAKQSSNPLFNFLNKNDILYPYYQRICLLMKMGIYTYSEEEINNKKDNNVNNNNNDNGKVYIHKKNNNTINNKDQGRKHDNDIQLNNELMYIEMENKIPENTKLIIEKMANYIARNGSEFETLVRQKNIGDERFSFMQPWNEFYNYYKYKINKYLTTTNHQKKIISSENGNNNEINNKENNYNNNNNDNNNNDNNNNDNNNNENNNNENKNNENNNSNNDNEENDNDNDNDNDNSNDNNGKSILSINGEAKLVEDSEEMKKIKAKRLLKMKEILARKRMKKG